ncbi:hypothetical protein BJ742DRAFT_783336 [Cladochytrium replicatum]|nr:hypothetical protein BJ742DRAFT_783336 [Cladochytrium replicatum]
MAMNISNAISSVPSSLAWCARQRPTPVNLTHLFQFGKHVCKNKPDLLIPAAFLHKELPVRYMQSVKLLSSTDMPSYLSPTHPEIQTMIKRMVDDSSYLTGISQPKDPREFARHLHHIQWRHYDTMLHLRRAFEGIDEPSPSSRSDGLFWDGLLTLNMGVRILIADYLSLVDKSTNLVNMFDPLAVARRAIDTERDHVAVTLFGGDLSKVPPVDLITASSNEKMTALYVEEHLERILREVLRSSLSSTISRNSEGTDMPKIKLIVVAGNEDIAFKVSDEAAGIPLSQQKRMWSYVMNATPHDSLVEGTDPLGVTLPSPTKNRLAFARVMARYFGGDLDVVSMEGHGSDFFIHLYKRDGLEQFGMEQGEQEENTSANRAYCDAMYIS